MFFLFTEKVIGIVLLMECMYYIMAIVYVRIVSRFIQVTLDKGLYSAEKNSEIPILIQIKNKNYTQELRNRGFNKIIKYGISFCRKKCRVMTIQE